MEYGLIKDTTIQGIADSLRDKGFIPKYYTGIVPLKFKSSNATSLTDPTPTHRITEEEYITISIDKAVKIEVIVDVGYYENPETPSYANAPIEFYFGNVDADTIVYPEDNAPVFISPKRSDLRQYTCVIPQNNFKIGIRVKDASSLDYVGLTVKAYALNAEGERIEIDTEETIRYAPSEIAEAVNNSIPLPPESAFKITGNCSNRFYNDNWSWFINLYGDKITTENITMLNYGFGDSKAITRLPFDINISNAYSLTSCFNNLYALTESPRVRGTLQMNTNLTLDSMISGCQRVRDFTPLFLPEMLDGFKDIKVTGAYSSPYPARFSSCYSLRQIPEWWYKFKYCEESTAQPSAYRALYQSCFSSCYALDEALNIPVWECAGPATSQMFGSTFDGCYRLKDATFETQADGTPYTAKWKSQTIDLSTVGYITTTYNGEGCYLSYNSGITADKKVYDDASYQALKNDPDWYPYIVKSNATASSPYSRYDHDSAVRTINSLPDTSAYLATAGGTNTIKFRGIAGELTDAGAINTLTAEEIAVAVAKGWTVSIV